MPFEHLPYFDYSEKHDVFAKNGLAPTKNLCDILSESGLKFHISDWRKDESQNIADAKIAVTNGADFLFILSYMKKKLFSSAINCHTECQRT